MLIAPVKNENSEVILFILNFDEMCEDSESKFGQGLKRNRLLQQIGMPFISSIFSRTSSPLKTPSNIPSVVTNEPFSYMSATQQRPDNSMDVVETMPLNNSKLPRKSNSLFLFRPKKRKIPFTFIFKVFKN